MYKYKYITMNHIPRSVYQRVLKSGDPGKAAAIQLTWMLES